MVKIEKDKPLPEHTKLDYQECYAKILLESSFKKFRKRLIIQDKPDLYDRVNDIGIEVTDIMSKDKKEAIKLYYMMPYTPEEKRPRKIERMAQLGVKYSGGVQMWPTIHYDKGLESKPFQELYESIRIKTKKLNSGNYTLFKRNELLLFSELWINGFEYLKLMDILKNIVNEGEIKFDAIYVVTAGKIYYFDFENDKCEEVYVFNHNKIAWAARTMVEDAEEMNKLERLILMLCPDGVEYKSIKDLVGVNRGSRLTKSQLIEDGNYEVYHGSKDTILGLYNDYNAPKNTTIVVNTGGIGGVKFLDKEFWCSDGSFWLGHSSEINDKFLYYYVVRFEEYFASQKRIGGVPTIDRSVVENLQVPIPPLEVQSEIVKILDNFTELTEELTEELTARKQQYEYYRENLLENEDGNLTTIGDTCNIITDYVAAGSFADLAKNVTYLNQPNFAQLVRTMDIKSKFSKGEPVYVDEKAFSFLRRVNFDAPCIILPNIGANCGEVYYVEPKDLPYTNNVLGPNAIMIKDCKCNIKYLYYLMQNKKFQDNLFKIISPGGQTKFNKTELKKIVVKIPPIEKQREIVENLDNFSKLCEDISEGLPAEIDERQKQYEYYRDKLLTFKEKKVN